MKNYVGESYDGQVIVDNSVGLPRLWVVKVVNEYGLLYICNHQRYFDTGLAVPINNCVAKANLGLSGVSAVYFLQGDGHGVSLC